MFEQFFSPVTSVRSKSDICDPTTALKLNFCRSRMILRIHSHLVGSYHIMKIRDFDVCQKGKINDTMSFTLKKYMVHSLFLTCMYKEISWLFI